MAWPLARGGAAASLYGLASSCGASGTPGNTKRWKRAGPSTWEHSIGFTVLLGAVMTASAGLNAWLGDAGILLGAAVSGFADAHATAASAASLMAAGEIQASQAIIPILLGLTTNTLTKAIVAFNAGGLAYASKIVPGLVLMVSATWAGVLVRSLKTARPGTGPILACAIAIGYLVWTEDAEFFGIGVTTWTSDSVDVYLAWQCDAGALELLGVASHERR